MDIAAAIAAAVADELERRGLTSSAVATRISTPWLTTDEAAEYLRASRQRVFDLTSQGHLAVYKDGARNLYRREDLDGYLRVAA
ncbi:MAG: helix-turn-helix domain-containing protein [Solirubrobacteraceae bacterium]